MASRLPAAYPTIYRSSLTWDTVCGVPYVFDCFFNQFRVLFFSYIPSRIFPLLNSSVFFNMAGIQESLTPAQEEEHSQTNPKDERNDRNQNNTNGIFLGECATTPQTDRFNPNFTQSVINATGPKASPRMRKVMASLIRHVHDFARENEVTVDELMAGIEMVSVCPLVHCSPVDSFPSRI